MTGADQMLMCIFIQMCSNADQDDIATFICNFGLIYRSKLGCFMENCSLLPKSKLYSKLLLPFFLPYALYTGVGIIANLGVTEWIIQLLKLLLQRFADGFAQGTEVFK